jgi:hypothetical protein
MDFARLPYTFLKVLVKYLNSLEVVNLLLATEDDLEKVKISNLCNLLFNQK